MVSRFFNTDLETCKLIPFDQLQVFLSRIDALRANESLDLIQNLQAGGGFIDKKDFRNITKELQDRQKVLFVGQDAIEKKKTRYMNILAQSGLPISHLLPPSGIGKI